LPGQRRRRNEPLRGEWVDLEPLEEPVLPEYDEAWQVQEWMWDAWRSSPETGQYGDADITSIRYLAAEFYDLPPAQRLALMDKLGLTPKGKRDLRWRTPNEVKTIKKAEEKAANVRKLHAVKDKEAG
jgi:hypothetical protein